MLNSQTMFPTNFIDCILLGGDGSASHSLAEISGRVARLAFKPQSSVDDRTSWSRFTRDNLQPTYPFMGRSSLLKTSAGSSEQTSGSTGLGGSGSQGGTKK